MEQQNFSPILINDSYNPETIQLIVDFKKLIEKKNAKLFLTYPCYQASSFDKSLSKIQRVENLLKKNKFTILGTPENYKFADSLMFNSSYHLLKKGVDLRTLRLIEDLKKSIEIN